jgi:hypothetical protein
MRNAPVEVLKRSQMVQGSGHWTWCYKVVVDEFKVGSQWYREVMNLTPWGEELPVLIGGVVTNFKPYPITQGQISSDSDGSVPTVDVTLGDTLRQAGRYVERGFGYKGRRVLVYSVNVETAEAHGPALRLRGWVSSVDLSQSQDESAVVLHASLAWSPFDGDLPHQIVQPTRCRHLRYARGRCGMILLPSTPTEFLTCQRTWYACIQRSAWMASNNLPGNRLPNRFGGFIAVPPERRTG